MLIRVLVAVLTLLGPVPLRVCTCAASAVPSPEPARLVAPTPASVKTCRCSHSTGGTGKADRAAHPELPRPIRVVTPGHSHNDGHAPDCQMVSPRPVVRDSVTVPPAFDLSQADAELPATIFASHSRAPSRQGMALPSVAHSVPLYLTLLVLRI